MVRTDLDVRPTAPKRKLTYQEFLEWAEDDAWVEWVDGEVVVLAAASLRHQQLKGFLFHVLDLFVQAFQLGIVLDAPFQMKLPLGGPGREPDLLFVAREHQHRLLRTRLDGPADLVIEIVSPESATRDRIRKYAEYEAAGVPEYWLLDPDARRAEFYLLGPAGQYQGVPVDESGTYRSRVVRGFWLRVDWLWQEPLPTLPVLRELALLRA